MPIETKVIGHYHPALTKQPREFQTSQSRSVLKVFKHKKGEDVIVQTLIQTRLPEEDLSLQFIQAK